MPYERTSDLPKGVKDNLPSHGQQIFLKAFNSAWDDYSDPKDRKGNESREEAAHRVAWAAVKQKYHKQGDRWVRDKD